MKLPACSDWYSCVAMPYRWQGIAMAVLLANSGQPQKIKSASVKVVPRVMPSM